MHCTDTNIARQRRHNCDRRLVRRIGQQNYGCRPYCTSATCQSDSSNYNSMADSSYIAAVNTWFHPDSQQWAIVVAERYSALPVILTLYPSFVGYVTWTLLTRQHSYRKEDRAMRPIYGCPEKFSESSLRTRLLFQKFVMDFCSDRY